MKILAGSFQCEANTFCGQRAAISDFELFEGEALLKKMAAIPVFREAGIEVVPLIYASSLPCGMVSTEAFEYYKNIFIQKISNEKEYDGIYLYLHGSMYVECVGSGEEALLQAIRKVTGYDIPISVALDYHANLSEEFLKQINAVQGFRTAPHTDQDDTEKRAANSLVKCIQQGICPKLSYIRIPFLGGDAATTDKEPFISVTRYLEELDRQSSVISCAFFNGQPWYDSPYTGNCAVISCTDENEGKIKARKLAHIFWKGRENLRIENAMPVKKAVEVSLKHQDGVLFVTDSGDNTTAGADGAGTLLLNEYLREDAEGVLICGILEKDVVNMLLKEEIGFQTEIVLCKGKKEKQEIETTIHVKLKGKGRVYGWAGDEVGEGVIVSSQKIDIVFTNARAAFTTPLHFKKMGITPTEYRVIVIKMGYLFPKLREISEKFIFALTPGSSTNDFSQLDYKHLKKRMYPVCQDITWEEILEEQGVSP